ncbi:3-hydroxybutyrate dehydrogenase [Bordetella bronchiseptica SBL-F6116]|nr:3-hydroxybutyrate dehydrogenase [Bordetella bronchiseptica SBL-F6116]
MLKGKVAVVTGSTSGIGLGIASALAQQGADIVLNGFGDAADIEKLRAGLASQYGVQVRYDGADLSRGEAVRQLVSGAVAELGRIDILVNNAGIQHTALIEDFPADKWDAIIALNLSAVFHGTAAALPHMKKQGWGRIINIASAHGLVASAAKSAYVAAKHGVVGLTKVTALETAGMGITANAICPGWVRTPLVEKQITALAAKDGVDQESAARELLGEKQPSLQFVTPEQLGGTAVFLASEAAAQTPAPPFPSTAAGQPASLVQIQGNPHVVPVVSRQEAGLRLSRSRRNAHAAAVRRPGRGADQGAQDQVRRRNRRADEPEPGAGRAERGPLRCLEAQLHAGQFAPGRPGVQWRRLRRAAGRHAVGPPARLGAGPRRDPQRPVRGAAPAGPDAAVPP